MTNSLLSTNVLRPEDIFPRRTSQFLSKLPQTKAGASQLPPSCPDPNVGAFKSPSKLSQTQCWRFQIPFQAVPDPMLALSNPLSSCPGPIAGAFNTHR